ncbi:MAG: agmatine deiminase family protein [Candidatus Neomarinimicrobiota bacterium]
MIKIIFILAFKSLLLSTDISKFELPIGLTDEERLRLDEINLMARSTDPPVGPLRNVAEFERMQGVLIRYPFGISNAIIAEISEDVKVYCLVSSSLETAAYNSMNNSGVNMNNVEFILGPTDSYWTRDYGPWWVIDGQKNMSIVDFTYNRPRPNDNDAPLKVSDYLEVPFYASDIIHAGGNYMTDGLGISASSDLVFFENEDSDSLILDLMYNYYGIQTYHVIDDPNNTYIDHIDCWGKYLSPTKVLIREVPENHPQYEMIEQTAAYFLNTVNKWGEPWELFRVWTPNNQPYTNSLILNQKILVPITGSGFDEGALLAYEEAMPGYEVLGFSGTWESTDALHCRIIGIPDLEMLQIFHNPINDGTIPIENGYLVNVLIDDLSESGLKEDSLSIFWKTSSMNDWNEEALLDDVENMNGFLGWIPPQTDIEIIEYFIKAADSSGRSERHPIAGWHSFEAMPTEACIDWILGDLDNSFDLNILDVLLMSDYIANNEVDGVCLEFVSDINNDNSINILDLIYLTNMIMNP